jgi:hypothetical protein
MKRKIQSVSKFYIEIKNALQYTLCIRPTSLGRLLQARFIRTIFGPLPEIFRCLILYSDTFDIILLSICLQSWLIMTSGQSKEVTLLA